MPIRPTSRPSFHFTFEIFELQNLHWLLLLYQELENNHSSLLVDDGVPIGIVSPITTHETLEVIQREA